ncbi:MAG: GTPase [Anaerolineae bacterium]
MKLGIIGLSNSGKTTIFNALTRSALPTGAGSSGQFEIHTAVVNVPDPRVDRLSAMYNPKKTIYTQVTYVDIGGLDKGIGEGGLKGQFRNELAQLDGFVHVVRGFTDENVPHPNETIDPKRDAEILDAEFLLTDLVMVRSRLERIDAELKRKGRTVEKAIIDEQEMMLRLKEYLEAEKPLRDWRDRRRDEALSRLRLPDAQAHPDCDKHGQIRRRDDLRLPARPEPRRLAQGQDRGGVEPARPRRRGGIHGRVRHHRAERRQGHPAVLRADGDPVVLHRRRG